jgi:hypothetical protein
MKLLVELAGDGKLRPRISHRFALEEAADAMQAVIDRKEAMELHRFALMEVCKRNGEGTLAGTHGNGRDAP